MEIGVPLVKACQSIIILRDMPISDNPTHKQNLKTKRTVLGQFTYLSKPLFLSEWVAVVQSELH